MQTVVKSAVLMSAPRRDPQSFRLATGNMKVPCEGRGRDRAHRAVSGSFAVALLGLRRSEIRWCLAIKMRGEFVDIWRE